MVEETNMSPDFNNYGYYSYDSNGSDWQNYGDENYSDWFNSYDDYYDYNDTPSYEHLHWVWVMLYTAIIVVSFVGNVIFICSVFVRKVVRRVAMVLLVNLAVVNILSCGLVVPFYLYHTMTTSWPFGALYCIIYRMATVFAAVASPLTLIALCVYQCSTIHKLHIHVPSSTETATDVLSNTSRLPHAAPLFLMSFLIWLFGLIPTIPMYFFSQVQQVSWDPDKYLCMHDSQLSDISMVILAVSLGSLIFVIPVIAVLYSFIFLGIKLCQKHAQQDKEKREETVVTLVITAIFVVTTLPLLVAYLLFYYGFIAVDGIFLLYIAPMLFFSNAMVMPTACFCIISRLSGQLIALRRQTKTCHKRLRLSFARKKKNRTENGPETTALNSVNNVK